MSEETEELLTGRAGNEAAQGYTPMPMANPDPPSEPAIDSDIALAKHFTRPQPPEPVERAYHDAQSGEPRADNETVPLDRAAEDLSEIRAAERRALQDRENRDLAEALDYLRTQALEQPQPQEPAQPAQPAQESRHRLTTIHPSSIPSMFRR
jgi:hypothetical protein